MLSSLATAVQRTLWRSLNKNTASLLRNIAQEWSRSESFPYLIIILTITTNCSAAMQFSQFYEHSDSLVSKEAAASSCSFGSQSQRIIPASRMILWLLSPVIKFLGENPGACPWDEAKKYFSKSLMSISSEYTLQI